MANHPPTPRMHHVGLVVSDMDAMVAFYAQVLEVVPPPVMHLDADHLPAKLGFPAVQLQVAEFALDGCPFELLRYVEPVGGGPALARNDAGAAHICLEVDDLEAKFRQCQANGVVAVSAPVRSVTGGHIGKYSVNLVDPEGNLVELTQAQGRKA